jgi:hypothetical protein
VPAPIEKAAASNRSGPVFPCTISRHTSDASGFLAQPQLEALKRMQEQMRTLNKAGLTMSKSMMGK